MVQTHIHQMEMRRNIIIHFPSISNLNLNIENMSRHKFWNGWNVKPFLWYDDCFVGLNLNKNCIESHQNKTQKLEHITLALKWKLNGVYCVKALPTYGLLNVWANVGKTFNLFGKSGNKLSMNWIRANTKHSIEKFIFINNISIRLKFCITRT